MRFVDEFREFATRGNVIDLAVGVIIGAAFGRIVDSLVRDIVMPIFNAALGGAADFSNRYIVLSGAVPVGTPLEAAQKTAVVLAYGNFFTVVINFILLAFIIFWMIKAVNRLKRPREKPTPATPEDVLLLREIRDALRSR